MLGIGVLSMYYKRVHVVSADACPPRCDAHPTNLDGPGSHRRSHKKTDVLINKFDPGILWDEFGIKYDIVVCSPSVMYFMPLAHVIH